MGSPTARRSREGAPGDTSGRGGGCEQYRWQKEAGDRGEDRRPGAVVAARSGVHRGEERRERGGWPAARVRRGKGRRDRREGGGIVPEKMG